MKVLCLNLNSYREENQIAKFHKIAEKIHELDVDVACFCEASQSLTNHSDKGMNEDNALKLICDEVNRLSDHHYEVRWEFSHYGFSVYEEGLGIISKLPIRSIESRFVSKSLSPFDYRSRKIIKAVVECDDSTKTEDVAIYTIHTNREGDPYDPFADQFKKIQDWINESKEKKYILAGDFGIDPLGIDYENLIDEGYIDFYKTYRPEGQYDPTFINPTGIEFKTEKKQRLDYIFGCNSYTCQNASYYFKGENRVSDHLAVYCDLK